MKTLTKLALSLGAFGPGLHAADVWRELTMPSVAEAARGFAQPPRETGAIHWAIWGGLQTKEKILGDIENLAANGTYVIMINASRGLQPKYFSPEYLELVKFTVAECKRRGMKVWLEDDAGYPSGFAGGLISQDHPELAMQGLVADVRYSVVAGQTINFPLPADTLGILAYSRAGNLSTVLPVPASGKFQWTAPNPGTWEVVCVRHVFRSSPTRYTNRADGTNDKDGLYSLIDYLNPDATRTYLKLIHEVYEKVVGEEFGKTVLGFRGDEPDYTGFMPWTPKLLATFQEVKGYDLKPFLVKFFEPSFTPETLRAKADYWDVWSAMFRDNFFKPQEEWCKARGMEYMVHLNHEELMLDLNRGEDLIRNEGSFFRAMRFVGVPGVDNLNQIGPGIVADFPKLAASTAHLYGRPQVWNEEGGGLNQSGKFVADYNFVRGLNFLQIRGLNLAPATTGEPLLNAAAAMAGYVNRASYLLTIGRPAAQVALYHPTDSMWMGDKEADDVTVKLVTQLMERQIDFDHIDLDALASVCTLTGGELRNLSGQSYRAIIVPSSTVIKQEVLVRLRSFAAGGGKVIFVGRTPSLVVGQSFLNATAGAPDLSFATLEPNPEISARVVAALPPPDVKLDALCPPLKYLHRTWKDGDVYFFFNESAQAQTRTVTLSGTGTPQIWDATSGVVHPVIQGPTAKGKVDLPIALGPQESRFVVIGPLPAGSGNPVPSGSTGTIVAELGGDWSIGAEGSQTSSVLKPWENLGLKSVPGTVGYKKEFTASAPAAGQRVFLDLGNVHEIARVRMNGVDLGALAWPPYIWDVTASIKAGTNTLELQVQAASGGGRGNFGGGNGNGRRGAAAPAAASGADGTPGFSPTGVPGGLGNLENGGGSRGRGAAGGVGAGGGRAGAPGAAAAVAMSSGVLGPVRLFAQ